MISVGHIYTAAKRLGFGSVVITLSKEVCFGLRSYFLDKKIARQVYCLPAHNLQFPLLCRALSSDLYVYYQIFVEMQYDCTDVIERPRLIVDCGANVGYTSTFYLNKYPEAQVIAVEPDPDNFEILIRNLHPYGKRVTAHNAAIWSSSTKLCVQRDLSGFRREWSTRTFVSEGTAGTGIDVDGIDIGRLLEDSGYERIDILKIDIEGSESVIFSENYAAWIDKVECFVIELHDDEDSERFFEALLSSNVPYRYSRSGELTVAIRETARV